MSEITELDIYGYLWKNEFDQLDQILDIEISNSDNFEHRVMCQLFQLRIERNRGNYKRNLKQLEDLDVETISSNELHALFIIEKASNLFREGSLDEADELAKEFHSLQLNAQSEFASLIIVEFFDLEAKLLITRQKLLEAEIPLNRALRLLYTIEHPIVEASVYNALGIIYFFKGKLQEANNYYRESLKMNLKIGNQRAIGICYSNIGYNYYIMGDPEESLENLLKAKQIFEELDIDYYRATTYFNLIRTLLYLDKTDQANDNFVLMEEVWNNQENQSNERIASVYKLTKGQLLLRGTRLREKIQAQQLFKEIIEEDLEAQFVIIAMIHLAEILILELRISEDEEIINEIEEIFRKVHHLAETMDSNTLRIHSILVDAKIKTIRGRYQEAFDLYKSAEKVAQEFGIEILHKRIISDLEEMKESVLTMKDVLDKNTTITQRIEHSEFENYLNSLKNLV